MGKDRFNKLDLNKIRDASKRATTRLNSLPLYQKQLIEYVHSLGVNTDIPNPKNYKGADWSEVG